jgi:uncharacterized protein involved in outer membrane biogenesis
MALSFPVVPLLRGRFELDSLHLDHATLALERGPEQVGNWTFANRGRARDEPGNPLFPALSDARMSRLVYLDHASGRSVELLLERARSRGGVDSPIELEVEGEYRVDDGDDGGAARDERRIGGRFVLGGEIGSVAQLRGDGGPARVRLRAQAGTTRARLVGVAADPPLDGLDAELTLSGASLEDLWPLTGVPFPQSPAYRARGRFGHRGDLWTYRDFDGVLGDTDLHGDFAVSAPRGERRRVIADLRSRRVDLDDLEGFWGKPVVDEDETGARAAGPVFSRQPFAFEKLRSVDAEVELRAGAVVGEKLLDALHLELELERGRLELSPLGFGFAGGRMMTWGVLDARRSPARFDARVVMSSLDLARLMRELDLPHRAEGVAGARAHLHAGGRSLHDLASTVDGELGLVLERGVIGETALELVALDFSEAALAHLYGNQQAPIECLVGVFDIADGRAEATTLLMDTEDVRVTGEGWIDLGEERLDLTLRPHPKDFSIGTLRSPIEIEGGLRDRRARISKTGLARRGGAAVALGVLVHPLAALVPLVELGRGEQPGACREALREYRQVAGAAARPQVAQRPRRGNGKG